MRLALFYVLTFSFFSGPCYDPITAKVMEITDGNTLKVITSSNETITIVLPGIDCPELTQPYGVQAKTYLEKLLLKMDVTIHIQGKDRRKNYVGVVLLRNIDVRLGLLKEGLAWTVEKDCENELENIRLKAAANKRGLWSQKSPTAPWLYRRQQSMLQPKSQ